MCNNLDYTIIRVDLDPDGDYRGVGGGEWFYGIGQDRHYRGPYMTKASAIAAAEAEYGRRIAGDNSGEKSV